MLYQIIRPLPLSFLLGYRIKISSLLWTGNVEIHICGTDWTRHGHHLDPAYENVILHVVARDPVPVFTCSGRRIPTLVLTIPKTIETEQYPLMQDTRWLSCHPFILGISRAEFQRWLTRLMEEREKGKTRRICQILKDTSCDWEECLHLILASALGLPVNRLPMELTLSGIPFKLLMERRHNRTEIEAMLFGQSGLLQIPPHKSSYQKRLLQLHSGFESLMTGPGTQPHLWKFLRLRPSSFPTLRLSQLASLVHLRYPLLESILDCHSLTEIEQVLRVKAGEYWDTHYLFGKPSPEKEKYLGEQSISHLIVNAVIPLLLVMGEYTSSVKCLQMASALLSDLRAESNSIIRAWKSQGIIPKNAFESQALLHLYREYCTRGRCMECSIGRKLIESGIKNGL